MELTTNEEIAHDFLANMGYSLTRVEESIHKTADFIATQRSETLIIECKSLINNSPQPNTSQTDEHNRRSGADSSARKSAKQIQSTRTSPDDIGVLWIDSLKCRDSEFQINRALGDLFGITSGIGTKTDSDGYHEHYKVFFYHQSRLERSPDIDCVITCARDGARLYANPFSNNYNKLNSTILCDKFKSQKAFIDPEKISSDSGYLSCLGYTKNRDRDAIKKYLLNRYGIPIQNFIDFKRYSAEIAVPLTKE